MAYALAVAPDSCPFRQPASAAAVASRNRAARRATDTRIGTSTQLCNVLAMAKPSRLPGPEAEPWIQRRLVAGKLLARELAEAVARGVVRAQRLVVGVLGVRGDLLGDRAHLTAQR